MQSKLIIEEKLSLRIGSGNHRIRPLCFRILPFNIELLFTYEIFVCCDTASNDFRFNISIPRTQTYRNI
jgi:hypothetical protein